jgi:glycosyltransferase involved in cell wall biosynthesis
MGSVSQIGWEWYSRLVQKTQVTLVTHVRNRECLVQAGAPLPGSEVIYIDTEWFACPLNRLSRRLFPRSEHAVFLLSSLDFYVYDAATLRLLRKRKSLPWDIVHAVTPVSPMAAIRLHKTGLPLIVGPWNGGLASPKTFPEIMKEDSSWMYGIRRIGRVLDWLFGTTRHAARILAATQSTIDALPSSCHERILRMLENGVDLDLFCPPAQKELHEELRVLFVGRLIPAKGVSLLLEAVRRVRNKVPLRLTITGDGPLLSSLQQEARDKGIADSVEFTGNLTLAQVRERMHHADLFCLPSVRESGGAVLLEAMACALPVAGVNWGGPAEIVDEEIGRLLPADGPEALVSGLVQLFQETHEHPEIWRRKGMAGRRRAEQKYGWEAKINTAIELYEEIIMTHTKVEYA